MKKYLLTLLAIFVILAPNVKAEECVNLLSSDTNFYYSNKGTGGWHGGIANMNKTVDGSSPEIITLDKFLKQKLFVCNSLYNALYRFQIRYNVQAKV